MWVLDMNFIKDMNFSIRTVMENIDRFRNYKKNDRSLMLER